MNVRLEYSLNVSAGVFWDDTLRMNIYHMKMYMITNCADNLSQNIAVERMKQFVLAELDSTIFINRDHELACEKLIGAGLKITTLPAEPVDQIIGMMLFSKLNAIMEDRIIINEIEISSNIGDSVVYLHSVEENLGPFAEPGWWHDSDLVHCDANLIDGEKVVALRQAGAWRELDLAWPDTANIATPENTIVFADFKKE